MGAGAGASEGKDADAGEQPAAEAAASQGAKDSAAKSERRVVYIPPPRGLPKERTPIGTRSAADGVRALAPPHVAWTLQSQPVLYWVLDAPDPRARYEFTLAEPGASTPVLQRPIRRPRAGGLQALRLAAFGVRLKRDTDYVWSVSVVSGGTDTRVVFSEGAIRRVAKPDSLAEESDYLALARGGVWYDALAQLNRSIQKRADATLVDDRRELLEQAGLQGVAARLR